MRLAVLQGGRVGGGPPVLATDPAAGLILALGSSIVGTCDLPPSLLDRRSVLVAAAISASHALRARSPPQSTPDYLGAYTIMATAR